MKLGKRKIIFIKVFSLIFLLFFTFITTISYLYKSININSENYLRLLLYDTYGNNYINTFIEFISNKLNPIELLEIENNEVKTPNIIKSNPVIYIYSDNPNLSYKYKYNIKPNIKLSMYYLANKLNSLNIPTTYENNDINSFSLNNNINKEEAIRLFINEKENNYNLKYIINLDISNIDRNINNYAGINLYTNNKNIEFITKLNSSLNKNINGISKIYYDNEYDYIRIEIGSNNSDFNSIKRSINILSNSIKEVFNE